MTSMDSYAVVRSDAGMHAVWDRSHFAGVVDYDSWEAQLLEDEDIQHHIEAGALVPINIRSDGAWGIRVRVDDSAMPTLSEAEAGRALVASAPYRFRSQGHLDLSGIEHIAATIDRSRVASFDLPAGAYDVRIHLMDYEDHPVRGEAEPDFIVTVGPPEAAAIRTAVETFDRG